MASTLESNIWSSRNTNGIFLHINITKTSVRRGLLLISKNIIRSNVPLQRCPWLSMQCDDPSAGCKSCPGRVGVGLRENFKHGACNRNRIPTNAHNQVCKSVWASSIFYTSSRGKTENVKEKTKY
jgi:hypothetical protein